MGPSIFATLIGLAITALGQGQRSQENAALPEPGDILAGFRANYQSFATLRVLWKRETAFDPSWFDYLAWQSQEAKKVIDSPSATASEKAGALANFQNYQKLLEDPKTREKKVVLSEFLTDRANCQVRVFTQTTEELLPAGYTFSPRVEAGPETLPTLFKDCLVFNHGISPQPENRMWFGVQKGKIFRAETTERRISHSRFYFPPLGIDTIEWADGWTDLDEFFTRPAAEMKVIRQEVLDGHKVYLLEHTRDRKLAADVLPKKLATKYPGKFGMLDATRVWVDPMRGFLPLRYEKGSVYTYDGKRVGPPKMDPYLAFTVTDLRQVENGGWYPMEGKTENFHLDPEFTKKGYRLNDLEKILGGTAENAPLKPYNTITWKALKIAAGEDLSGCFKLEFPTNTEYFDGKIRTARFVGNVKDYLDLSVASLSDTEFRPPDIGSAGITRGMWILIASNLAVLVIVGLIILGRYRRRKGVENP